MANMNQEMYSVQGKVGNKVYYQAANVMDKEHLKKMSLLLGQSIFFL